MKNAQFRYKGNPDTQARSAWKTMEIGQNVNFEWPALTTSASECLTTDLYNKLLSVKKGPFKVAKVLPTTVMIDEDGTQNKVWVDQTTVDPTVKETPSGDDVMQSDNTSAEHDQPHVKGSISGGERVGDTWQEFAVDRMLRHVGEGNPVRYIVR